jgi:hypothetical protein
MQRANFIQNAGGLYNQPGRSTLHYHNKHSMYRTSLILLTGTLLCALLLFLLVKLTGMPNEQKNGFTRSWLSSTLNPIRQTRIESPLEKITGATLHHFFFSVPNPQWMVMMDQGLDKQDTISFPVPAIDQLSGARYSFVDSPWIYLHANNIPALFYASFDSGHLKAVKLATSLFTRSVQVSPDCMVVRAFDSTSQKQIFQCIDCHTGQVTRQATIIEQDSHDNGFSTDGLLQYDSLSKRLLFIQCYQNRFFCLDTNLNLQYKGITIDTISKNLVSIQKVQIDQEERLMPASPRAIVNEQAFVSNGVLFILSGLIADNEEPAVFRRNAAIDCYRISNGRYIGSFHIPLIDGEKIKSFLVKANRLIALYLNHIGIYKVPGSI